MSNGTEAIAVLAAECDGAIERIKKNPGMKSCSGHQPLASGVIVLLRCQKAELERRSDERRQDHKSRRTLICAIAAGVIVANAGNVVAWIKTLFGS